MANDKGPGYGPNQGTEYSRRDFFGLMRGAAYAVGLERILRPLQGLAAEKTATARRFYDERDNLVAVFFDRDDGYDVKVWSDPKLREQNQPPKQGTFDTLMDLVKGSGKHEQVELDGENRGIVYLAPNYRSFTQGKVLYIVSSIRQRDDGDDERPDRAPREDKPGKKDDKPGPPDPPF